MRKGYTLEGESVRVGAWLVQFIPVFSPLTREALEQANSTPDRHILFWGIYDRYPIQRLFRDQHALAAHIGFSWDAQGGPWAQAALGGEFSNPVM